MRLERLNGDKIKIFLTFDDLNERGISKDDLWEDLPKVQQLFKEMILEADDELGFVAEGPIEVEVFSLPAQGMVVIVSKSLEYDFIDEPNDFIEMQVTLDESYDILYRFDDIEPVIDLSKKLLSMGVTGGQLYSYNNTYYLIFEELDFLEQYDVMIAVLSEYGSPSTMTDHYLNEYGNPILTFSAVRRLTEYF
ncbi:genetic competence negative regulator [Tuberibacillus sp. Marseille-P3662]|uniref:genetic competence negative regulator n=1 Tax=Tuberibacillus sp. Marseille-P3662 TaxID=1965358 RepID=UPI000A1CC4B6|nr:genetic competence negative regulator [Tuberibacillus sp. Marseille-P3662]